MVADPASLTPFSVDGVWRQAYPSRREGTGICRDGNGTYERLGNVLANPQVGPPLIDFDPVFFQSTWRARDLNLRTGTG